MESANIKKFKCDILSNFLTMWSVQSREQSDFKLECPNTEVYERGVQITRVKGSKQQHVCENLIP